MLKDRQAEDKNRRQKGELIFAFLAGSYQALSKIEFDNYSKTGDLIMGSTFNVCEKHYPMFNSV